MALSTTFTQILVQIESSYTASYIKTIGKYCALSLAFMKNESSLNL